MSNEEIIEHEKSSPWSLLLPDHIIIKILQFLPLRDAFSASRSCSSWYDCFGRPKLWRTVEFNLDGKTNTVKEKNFVLNIVQNYGYNFENLILRIDQTDQEIRNFGMQFLNNLIESIPKKIRRLRIEFIGTNPLFYAGTEFVEILRQLFSDINSSRNNLEWIDFSRLPIMHTNELYFTLAENHFQSLKYLNIQTKQLIDKISPECILNLVQKCRSILDLRLFHSNLSEDILDEFSNQANQNRRSPLAHLSIVCRRQERYFYRDLGEECWQKLVRNCPKLEVTLKFDHTCPLELVRDIMKPCIPVRHLFMEMYTTAHELALAVEYYHLILRKLVTQARPFSSAFQSALLDAADWCHQLTSLHVMCLLDKETVEGILARRPALKANNRSTTLKYEMEPHPWVTDEILDDLPVYVL